MADLLVSEARSAIKSRHKFASRRVPRLFLNQVAGIHRIAAELLHGLGAELSSLLTRSIGLVVRNAAQVLGREVIVAEESVEVLREASAGVDAQGLPAALEGGECGLCLGTAGGVGDKSYYFVKSHKRGTPPDG